MERVIDVAQFIFDEYKRQSGEVIDEMKLHKLLYLAQRENIAILGEPMFPENFEGWRYGPVCREVRLCYTSDGMNAANLREISSESAYISKSIVLQYGAVESWKLSQMSHNEISWVNARKGLSANTNGDRILSLDDIRIDAGKVRPYDPIWDMYYDEFEDAEVAQE
ncbi:MAG: DUF4065 domain-containing protein [Lachnospiraceae bacterium]|nr:DUF4065 domain-containing protein [Lachnospiraceae bacterium]